MKPTWIVAVVGDIPLAPSGGCAAYNRIVAGVHTPVTILLPAGSIAPHRARPFPPSAGAKGITH